MAKTKAWDERLKDLNMTTKELQLALGLAGRETVRKWLRGDSIPNPVHQEQIVAIEDKLYRASLNKEGKVKV